MLLALTDLRDEASVRVRLGHRPRRGVRGGGRARRRPARRARASAATSRSPASRPTCTSASRRRACWRCGSRSRAAPRTARRRGWATTRSCARSTCSAPSKSLPFASQSSELFDRPSINLGRILGGDALNKVPDTCFIDVDIRYLPEQDPDAILDEVRTIPGAEVVSTFKRPPAIGRPRLDLRARALRRRGAAPRRRGDERRPRRRLRRRLLPARRHPGGRVRPRRRRPPRPRRVGLGPVAGELPPARSSTSSAALPGAARRTAPRDRRRDRDERRVSGDEPARTIGPRRRRRRRAAGDATSRRADAARDRASPGRAASRRGRRGAGEPDSEGARGRTAERARDADEPAERAPTSRRGGRARARARGSAEAESRSRARTPSRAPAPEDRSTQDDGRGGRRSALGRPRGGPRGGRSPDCGARDRRARGQAPRRGRQPRPPAAEPRAARRPAAAARSPRRRRRTRPPKPARAVGALPRRLARDRDLDGDGDRRSACCST